MTKIKEVKTEKSATVSQVLGDLVAKDLAIKKINKEEREILKQEKRIEKALKQIRKAQTYIAFAQYHTNKIVKMDWKSEEVKKKAGNFYFDLNNVSYYLTEFAQYLRGNN